MLPAALPAAHNQLTADGQPIRKIPCFPMGRWDTPRTRDGSLVRLFARLAGSDFRFLAFFCPFWPENSPQPGEQDDHEAKRNEHGSTIPCTQVRDDCPE